ncbi:MAG: ribbon-helix-helix domain-containing protein [Proteobacteria bacterium]|nr:ribbon-helix-helix domain-containing protein [Pseudomonadota bacterium]
MTTISVRISNELLQELDMRAKMLNIQRAEYIRKAIESMNHEILNQENKKKIMQASLRVREESMKINAEFSRGEHDPET